MTVSKILKSRWLYGGLVIVILSVLITTSLRNYLAPSLRNEYHAVLLANGSLYFGKLERLWSPYPILTDVYYVQQVNDPEKKTTSSVLLKRGKEWHAPDRMILNANQILLIEPVTKGSRVAELIEQSKH